MTNNDLIATVLGTSAIKFGVTIQGRERTAWRTAGMLTLDEGLELAQRHWRAFELQGLVLFAGRKGDDDSCDSGVYLFAIQSADWLAVIEFAQTGPDDVGPIDFDFISQHSRVPMPEGLRKALEADEHGISKMQERLRRNAQLDWRGVQQTLQPFYERIPFAIFFADRKGVKAVFKSPITPEFARELGDAICEIDPDLCGSIGPDEMEGFILERNGFELWWD